MSADLPPDVDPASTRVIRSASAQVLKDELHGLLIEGESTWVLDSRDLVIEIASIRLEADEFLELDAESSK